jgi:sugar O-acyltransferase (sialic acid O-acetyltransferase NeuD family)
VKENMGLPVIGTTADMKKYVGDADFFVAIGNNERREYFIECLLSMGASIPKLIHPNAVIAAGVQIGLGSSVMAGTVINPCTKIGKGVIVNTGASIDHDCTIGDYAHVAVGVHVAGMVNLGNRVWLKTGAVINNGVAICANSIVGPGAVVVNNIIEQGTYIGVSAKIES